MAGVLGRFAIDGFAGATKEPFLVIAMFLTFVIARPFLPRYAAIVTLFVGVVIAVTTQDASLSGLDWSFAPVVVQKPSWSAAAMLSIALPVLIVTMTGQNLPGVAAIRTAGYDIDVDRVIGATGVTTSIIALFGAIPVNLSAITAALALSPESHPDRDRRYIAPLACALAYIVVGLFGPAVAGLFTALGPELVKAVAALALLGTIGNALTTAVAVEADRDAAVITFLVTLSGVTLAKIGSAFWGVVAGVVVLAISALRRRMVTAPV